MMIDWKSMFTAVVNEQYSPYIPVIKQCACLSVDWVQSMSSCYSETIHQRSNKVLYL